MRTYGLDPHGQVPQRPTYGIIGDGRVARHFVHYFDLLRIPHRQWSRRLQRERTSELEPTLSECNVILLLVSDAAIEPLIHESTFLKSRTLVHFSGSLVTPLAQGAHPLMTFGPETYDLATYETISFVTDRPAEEFRQLFPDLKNPVHTIPADLKPLYHALCVLAGNFSILLWQKLFRDFETKLGLPRETALPYLRQVAQNLAEDPRSALTGPLPRSDWATVERNLASLTGDPYREIYRRFVEAYRQEVKHP